jgi:hypothetical protein
MISSVYEEGVRVGKFREDLPIEHADIAWSMFTGLVIWEESKSKFLKTDLGQGI